MRKKTIKILAVKLQRLMNFNEEVGVSGFTHEINNGANNRQDLIELLSNKKFLNGNQVNVRPLLNCLARKGLVTKRGSHNMGHSENHWVLTGYGRLRKDADKRTG